MPLLTCATLERHRFYRFVYDAPINGIDYVHQVAPVARNDGYPYHVITGGAGCDPPALPTIEIDEDGDFVDDSATYVPKGRVTNEEVPPPEIVVMARLPVTQSVGQHAVFEVVATTRYPGACMNLRYGAGDEPDYALAPGAGAPIPFVNGLASASVQVTDWGGSATLRVTVVETGDTAEITIPIDRGPNGLPDAGWRVAGEDLNPATWTMLSDTAAGAACSDGDAIPAGNGTAGDGLTTWEEYRGFIVQGVHIRTDPRTKDLFVHRQDVPAGITNEFTALGTVDHLVNFGELSWENSGGPFYINGYRPGNCPRDSVNALLAQRAVLVRYWRLGATAIHRPPSNSEHPAGWAERTPDCTSCGVGCVMKVHIYEDILRLSTPPDMQNQLVVDDPDDRMGTWILSHEIGHAVGIEHYNYCGTAPALDQDPDSTDPQFCRMATGHALDRHPPLPMAGVGPTSVMCRPLVNGPSRRCWIRNTCSGTNNCPDQNAALFVQNLPHQYHGSDAVQLCFK